MTSFMDGPLQAGQSLYFAVAQQTAATLETHLIICHSYVVSTWIIKFYLELAMVLMLVPQTPFFGLQASKVLSFNQWPRQEFQSMDAKKESHKTLWLPGNCSLQKSLKHLCMNKNSKSYRCQSPMAPVRTRALNFIILLHSKY